WAPGSRLVAFCRGGRVVVRAERGPTLPVIVGCAPAWAASGALTLVRQGTVVQFVPHGRAEVILPRHGVTRVAWLGHTLAAVVGRSTLVLTAGGAFDVERRLPGPIDRLWASPRGTWLAVRTGRRIVVLDRRLHIRNTIDGGAIAWSPDERWTALANAGRVSLVRNDGRATVTLQLRAHDLAWR
ncbi:MAG: hypothetical protein QOE36_2649, partial [Gaiellaceae bacterium]|nr:hypothetical protein [Gaiellaceae bacterium]